MVSLPGVQQLKPAPLYLLAAVIISLSLLQGSTHLIAETVL
jgi:hypothetical protein